MRRPHVPLAGASPRLQSEIRTLDAQKHILEKSIARLYADGMGLSPVQRSALLSRYQEQLGAIGVHMQKLTDASKHPDLGSLGDGLVTLMDQKLSGIEEKFGQLAAKLDAESAREPKPKKAVNPEPVTKQTMAPDTKMVAPESGRRIELATLTEIPPRGTVPAPPLVVSAGHAAIPSSVPIPQPQTVPGQTPAASVSETPGPKVSPPALETVPTPAPGVRPLLESAPEPEYVPPKVDPPIIETPEIGPEIDEPDNDTISDITKDIQDAIKKLDQAEVE